MFPDIINWAICFSKSFVTLLFRLMDGHEMERDVVWMLGF